MAWMGMTKGECIHARYGLANGDDPRRTAQAIGGGQSCVIFLAAANETAALRERAGARIKPLCEPDIADHPAKPAVC